MTLQEFWDMTPREFRAMFDRFIAARDAEDYRAGVIAAVIVNNNPYRKPGARVLQPSDFFPHLKPKRRRVYVTPAQAQQILAYYAELVR